MSQPVSFVIASVVTVTAGDVVSVVSGEVILADSTDLAIGVAVEGGTAGEFIAVQTSGDAYVNCSGAIPAGARVQANTSANGTVVTGAGVFGRFLGTAIRAAVGGLVLVNIAPFDEAADT
jgi:hypothetical protein